MLSLFALRKLSFYSIKINEITFKIHRVYSKIVQSQHKEEKPIYILKRQDDNGNIFIIGKYSTIDQAQDLMKKLTQNVHKQHYWIETNS